MLTQFLSKHLLVPSGGARLCPPTVLTSGNLDTQRLLPELVAHRLDSRDLLHQVPVHWLKVLDHRSLMTPHQDGENVSLVSGCPYGRMVAVIDQIGVTMARHRNLRFFRCG